MLRLIGLLCLKCFVHVLVLVSSSHHTPEGDVTTGVGSIYQCFCERSNRFSKNVFGLRSENAVRLVAVIVRTYLHILTRSSFLIFLAVRISFYWGLATRNTEGGLDFDNWTWNCVMFSECMLISQPACPFRCVVFGRKLHLALFVISVHSSRVFLTVLPYKKNMKSQSYYANADTLSCI